MLVVYLYVAISLFYSQYLKTRPLADVFCLGHHLYTIRLTRAVSLPISS
jgi:4-hydroxybenzoate polyprenyltransferase